MNAKTNRSILLGISLGFLQACTLNVASTSEERTATYAATDWTTLHIAASPESSAMTVHGRAETPVDVTATVGLLTASGEQGNSLADAQISLQRSDNVLALDLSFLGPHAEGVSILDLTANVPASARLDLEASDAAIDVSGMTGDVQARTTNGSLKVETTGTVTLASTNGSIEGHGAGGTVQTSNGGVRYTWQGSALGPLSIETSNGGIVLHVPAGIGFNLDLATSNGEVNVVAGGTTVHDQTYTGAIHGGGPAVVLRTSNGSIDVTE